MAACGTAARLTAAASVVSLHPGPGKTPRLACLLCMLEVKMRLQVLMPENFINSHALQTDLRVLRHSAYNLLHGASPSGHAGPELWTDQHAHFVRRSMSGARCIACREPTGSRMLVKCCQMQNQNGENTINCAWSVPTGQLAPCTKYATESHTRPQHHDEDNKAHLVIEHESNACWDIVRRNCHTQLLNLQINLPCREHNEQALHCKELYPKSCSHSGAKFSRTKKCSQHLQVLAQISLYARVS